MLETETGTKVWPLFWLFPRPLFGLKSAAAIPSTAANEIFLRAN